MAINGVRRPALLMAAFGLILCLSGTSFSYSVLTHQAIIDSAWDGEIKPLLLKRFPGATEEALREAHAHAYGGAISQDMATTRSAASSSQTWLIT